MKCVRIGEDIREKLDYGPGVFTLEGHIGGKWYAVSATAVLASCALPPAKTRVSAGGLLRFAQLNRQDPHAISRTSSRACPRGPAHRRIIAASLAARGKPAPTSPVKRSLVAHDIGSQIAGALPIGRRQTKTLEQFRPSAIVKLDRRVKGARSRKVLWWLAPGDGHFRRRAAVSLTPECSHCVCGANCAKSTTGDRSLGAQPQDALLRPANVPDVTQGRYNPEEYHRVSTRL
ncbi:hypothetical protein OKW28_005758 [Paraburkholderia sp. 40]